MHCLLIFGLFAENFIGKNLLLQFIIRGEEFLTKSRDFVKDYFYFAVNFTGLE